MDIQKENTKYLASLLANCGATQDEINDLSFDDEVGFFESNRLADWFVSQINFGWRVWQAAKTQAVPKWISVEDGLPSDGQNIIAFDAIKHCVFKDGEFLQGYFEPDTGHEYTEPVDVTHWIAIEPQEPANE